MVRSRISFPTVLVGLAALATALAPGPAAAATRVAVLSPTAPWSPDCQGTAWRKDKVLLERCTVLETLADEARAGALAALDGHEGHDVMTRENTAQLLKEMGDASACSEGECEVETAKLIGADYVVSGNVALVEETWFVTMKLHAVKTAKLLRTSDRLKGRTQVEVIEAVRSAAEALVRGALKLGETAAGGARPAGKEGSFEEAPGAGFAADAEEVVVAFESAPDGAVVRVDGQLLCASTPCKKRLLAGPHQAVFERERYGSTPKKFTAAKGATVKGDLAPRFGWMSVETTPPGVGIAVDGTDAGRSPVDAREVDEGTVEVSVADACWLRSGERVTVKAGERRTVKLTPRPRLARLKVNAEDQKGNAVEADVTVDGAVAGPTGTTLKVPVCARKVSVPLGKETFEAELKLDEAKVAVIAARPGAAASAGGMARLPGGTYTTGEASRRVSVQPFLLDVVEVTVAAYGECVKAGKCTDDGLKSCGAHSNYGRKDRADHPINCVDLDQAAAYCAAGGRRLPTEEEWEWAARGADKGTAYPWGDDVPRTQLCWDGEGNDAGKGKRQGTCPAGSHPRGDSPQGVKDLAGNVWEWIASAEGRVTRGGSWASGDAADVTAASRDGEVSSDRTRRIGFRCAKSP